MREQAFHMQVTKRNEDWFVLVAKRTRVNVPDSSGALVPKASCTPLVVTVYGGSSKQTDFLVVFNNTHDLLQC